MLFANKLNFRDHTDMRKDQKCPPTNIKDGKTTFPHAIRPRV
jgi:hypothetical protein